MTYRFRWLILICAFAAVASAQTADTYINSSTDGSTLYSTGVLQYNGNCSGCENASHTYQQTVQMTSPSGRGASCSNGPLGAPAINTIDMQCPVQLTIGQDYGDYTVEYDPY